MNQTEQTAAKRIRAQYTEQTPTELDALRALDRRVKRPVTVFSYLFGSISAVIMGCGMSLIMTDIAKILSIPGNPMLLGIVIGAVGLLLSLLTYPIHRAWLTARKKKYANEIVARSEAILNA